MVRLLQASSQNTQGRTILTVLYLIVLALCFIVPVFYYFRLHCQEQRNRRLRQQQQRQIILASMAGNQGDNEEQAGHPEARASRKKYRAERRARILQLFGPVSMILREEHFHLAANSKPAGNADDNIVAMEEAKPRAGTETDRAKHEEDTSSDDNYDFEKGKHPLDDDITYDGDPYAEESDFVEIPGRNGSGTRLVPCLCVICLQQYEIGEEIVWSSNPDCEHVFHESCIERWLIKQRGGPLCPNCRRDFIIDPYDLESPSHDDEEEANIIHTNENT